MGRLARRGHAVVQVTHEVVCPLEVTSESSRLNIVELGNRAEFPVILNASLVPKT